MSTLESKIRICKGIRLDKDYNNVLDYSHTNLLALCESNAHLVASANDYSFIRARGTISVNFTYAQCLQSNYMAFQNKDYDNKWFFAFIDDVIYVNDNTTEIQYTIDVWSTWWDNWQRDTCFVIREHTNNDTIGSNTVPENIETGDYIIDACDHDTSLNSYYYVIQSLYDTNGNKINSTNYGGIYLAGRCLYVY